MSEGESRPPDGPESDKPEWQPPVPPGPPPPEWEPPPAPQPPPPPPPLYEPPSTEAPAGYPPPGYSPPPAPPQPQSAPGTWRGRVLARWWQRVGAALLDGLIVGIPITALVLAVEPALGLGLGLLAALTYYPLLMMREGEANGQTLGKQVVGIRAVQESGEPFTYGAAVLREFAIKNLLFGTLGGFFLGIPTLLNYLWPLWDDENRALHDMLASSRVVQA